MEWGCDVEIGVGLDRGLGLTWDSPRAGSACGAARLRERLDQRRHRPRADAHLRAVVGRGERDVARGLGPPGISVIPSPDGARARLLRRHRRRDQRRQVRARDRLGRDPQSGFRTSLGLPDLGPIGAMREYLTTVRALLAGETVTHAGKAITLNGVSLGFTPPCARRARRPRPADAAAGQAQLDGAALNWCDAERSPPTVRSSPRGQERRPRPERGCHHRVHPICVDDDEDAARLRQGADGVRDGPARRQQGAWLPRTLRADGLRRAAHRPGGAAGSRRPRDRADRRIPGRPGTAGRLLRAGLGAAAASAASAEGLDIAIVRVVAARPAWSRSRPSWRRASRPASLLTCPRTAARACVFTL